MIATFHIKPYEEDTVEELDSPKGACHQITEATIGGWVGGGYYGEE
ncbi:hypothetical protein FACS1894190_03750 [Spirochaetia bacterium]|nr:hypothetical protein FACS1894190_03750 [Spirochaetia bacterium]